MMTAIVKTIILVGIVFIIVGAGLYLIGKIPGIGRLPGDIVIKKENFTFYFPLTTCIIISIILSLILFLWHQR